MKYFLIGLFLSSYSSGFASTNYHHQVATKDSAQHSTSIFIGIQPGITVEPFYTEGEFDVNILPVVLEKPFGQRTTLKVTPLINYHIGGLETGISDMALFTVIPFYLKKRNGRETKPYGFYVGPVFGFGRNLINDHYTTTLAVEPGYMFETKNRFTISLGIQLGGSHFTYDNEPNKWVTHWGPKVSFGFWL